jgi:asparagine synthetase B (glutamine-hydrolysing)
MDTIADPDITFDENGICNYYYEYQKKVPQRLFHDDPTQIEKIVDDIRKKGKGKDYDCLIGVSGGVDSTYVAYLTKSLGLRPLAMHFDNGWNSELAIKNIENTLRKLNIDLITHVIDWEEFKSLQLAFLHASTPDGEIPTDHAIFALLFKIANDHNIKYIINVRNAVTSNLSHNYAGEIFLLFPGQRDQDTIHSELRSL